MINSVVNAANNINNNDNNNNNNNNDNNNNNNNVNIQNSNNNQNNQNMAIAGRDIPLEEVLKLQERLARHHKKASEDASNGTLVTVVEIDPVTKEARNKTVLLPKMELIKDYKIEKRRPAKPLVDIIKETLMSYLPDLATDGRKRKRSLENHDGKCNMSLEDRDTVMEIMEIAWNMLDLVLRMEIEGRVPAPREICDIIRVIRKGEEQVVSRVRGVLLEAAMDMWGVLQEYNQLIIKC